MKHLSEHKNSGRYLPHEETSYFGLMLVTFLAGVVLFVVPQLVSAGSAGPEVNFTAATPPIITQPRSGSHVNSQTVTVAGNCPSGQIMAVTRNGVIGGTALCADGSFGLAVDLVPGKNKLTAAGFNPGPAGPDSSAVNIYFDKPNDGQSVQLLISGLSGYAGQQSGQDLELPLNLSGGQPPYAIKVDWDDGLPPELISLSQPGRLTPRHRYTKVGNFSVKLKATDAHSGQAQIQMAVVISSSSQAAGNNLEPKGGLPGVAWPVYIGLVLLVICFWLGERFEVWLINWHLERQGYR